MDSNMLLSKLFITACLSGGLAIVTSLSTIVMSTIALIFRYECDIARPPVNGADYFIITLIKIYILSSDCEYALETESLTKSASIFIFLIIMIIVCLIQCSTAAWMLTVVSQYEQTKSTEITIYAYICASLAALVVDLTLGVHFGIDFATMHNDLNLNIGGLAINYEKDIIRLSSLLLMSVALKGYLGYVMNIILLLLLVKYLIAWRSSHDTVQHSIHKHEALDSFREPSAVRSDVVDRSILSPRGNALDVTYTISERAHGDYIQNVPRGNDDVSSAQRRFEEPWTQRRDAKLRLARSTNTNSEFNDGEPQSQSGPMKENPIAERSYDPSWYNNSGAIGRPFSYSESPKTLPVKTTPATDHWRRDLLSPAPYLPKADYSPPTSRLKSAMKSNYVT